MLEFIEQAIKLLVDKPDEVKVDIVETEQRIIYELTVGEGDYGKVIGKSGRNISAIRTLVFAINAKEGGKRACLLYTSPSPRDRQKSRMPSSA